MRRLRDSSARDRGGTRRLGRGLRRARRGGPRSSSARRAGERLAGSDPRPYRRPVSGPADDDQGAGAQSDERSGAAPLGPDGRRQGRQRVREPLAANGADRATSVDRGRRTTQAQDSGRDAGRGPRQPVKTPRSHFPTSPVCGSRRRAHELSSPAVCSDRARRRALVGVRRRGRGELGRRRPRLGGGAGQQPRRRRAADRIGEQPQRDGQLERPELRRTRSRVRGQALRRLRQSAGRRRRLPRHDRRDRVH